MIWLAGARSYRIIYYSFYIIEARTCKIRTGVSGRQRYGDQPLRTQIIAGTVTRQRDRISIYIFLCTSIKAASRIAGTL